MTKMTVKAKTDIYPRYPMTIGTSIKRLSAPHKCEFSHIVAVRMDEGGTNIWGIMLRDLGWVRPKDINLNVPATEFDRWLKSTYSNLKDKTINYPTSWRK